MVNTALRSNASLGELLTARARGASDRRLRADIAGGVLVAAALLFWRPQWWPVPLSAALCFAAFGVWGVADRALLETGNLRLRVLRSIAAAIGVAAAIVLAFGLVAIGVGRVIS